MVCAAVRRIHEYLGRRGQFLAALGIGKTCYGAGFAVDPPPARGLELLTDIAPITTWAWLWIGAGMVTFGSAWLRIGRDGAGFVAALIPPTVWATAYTVAAISGDSRGGYVAAWYLTSHVVVILWASSVPEHSVPPPPRRLRKGAIP